MVLHGLVPTAIGSTIATRDWAPEEGSTETGQEARGSEAGVAVIHVTQTILLGDPSGRPGNCLQAAVASLLDLPLDAVPHFAESTGDWVEDFVGFVQDHGYGITWHGSSHEPPAVGLAFGFTNRSAERHAVVYRDGQMAWDPHPSRDGLTSVMTYVHFQPAEVPA